MALLRAKTEGGWVVGQPAGNQAVSVFKGIPFAAPPVGELRWKAPQPVIPWEGDYQAVKFSNIAMQPRQVSEGGGEQAVNEFYVIEHPTSEDCLYLNVWTPAEAAGEKLPVALYLHGGGHFSGYSFLQAYDGECFAKRGVIFVSANYRLNMFGYIAHPELTAEDPHHSSGNYGTLDQVAAVKWVHDNIEAFGGDPGNVTIFGQSSGGQSTTHMCVTPLTKGMFQHAIVQSGGSGVVSPNAAFNQMSLHNAELAGQEFFEFCGFKNLAEARAADAQYILDKSIEYRPLPNKKYPLVYGPTVDGYLFEADPLETFRANKHHDIDYMCGSTCDEYYNANAVVPPVDVVKAQAVAQYGDKADKYLEVVRPEDPEYAIQFFNKTFGDNKLAGNLALCELQLEKGRRPAYIYYFTQVPPSAPDCHHSAEHHYVFHTFTRSRRPYGAADFDFANKLTDYWANFMKTGNPNGGDLPKWTPYTLDAPYGMELKYKPGMIKIPETPYVEFRKNFALGRV